MSLKRISLSSKILDSKNEEKRVYKEALKANEAKNK